MLKDITIGQYISGHSFLHKMDPRGKIIAVMLYMIALFVINNTVGYWSMVAVSILIVLISQVPLKFFLKGLKPMVFIVILTVVLQMFMTPGEILWQWGFLRLTREGIKQAIFMGTRLVLLVGITSVLTLTTTPISLTDGIEQLLKPLSKIGVPAHELVFPQLQPGTDFSEFLYQREVSVHIAPPKRIGITWLLGYYSRNAAGLE